MTMPAGVTVRTYTCPWRADVVQRLKELAECASGIVPVDIPLEPFPSDILAMRDDMEVIARKVDAVWRAYGALLHAHSPRTVTLAHFDSPTLDALDGYAFFDIDESADAIREAWAEAAE